MKKNLVDLQCENSDFDGGVIVKNSINHEESQYKESKDVLDELNSELLKYKFKNQKLIKEIADRKKIMALLRTEHSALEIEQESLSSVIKEKANAVRKIKLDIDRLKEEKKKISTELDKYKKEKSIIEFDSGIIKIEKRNSFEKQTEHKNKSLYLFVTTILSILLATYYFFAYQKGL